MRWITVESIAVGCLGLAGVLVVLWFASLQTSIGIFSLGWDTSMRIARGVIEVRHTYAYNIAPPVPETQWHTSATARGGIAVPPMGDVPMISFSSGHVVGYGSTEHGPITPANYWLLRIPLWLLIIPPGVLGWWLILKWRQKRHGARRGFEVQPLQQSPQSL